MITDNRLRGTLLGLAVGDALGAAWEGMPADLIYDMGPADQIVAHPTGDPLCYTDDTQMMIGVLQTLVEFGRIEV